MNDGRVHKYTLLEGSYEAVAAAFVKSIQILKQACNFRLEGKSISNHKQSWIILKKMLMMLWFSTLQPYLKGGGGRGPLKCK